MLEFPKWKVWLVTLVVALGVLLSLPSLLERTPLAGSWPKWLPDYKISLGLDLAGGSHLLLEADQRDALKQRLAAMEDAAASELRRDPRIDIGDFSIAAGRLSFQVRDPLQVNAAADRLRKLTQPSAFGQTREWDVATSGTSVTLTPTPGGTAKALKDAMGVARDVVRRRIDPSGTKETTVVTEGGNRILVEVPGVEDPEALKRLIGQTARLEFKLLDMSANPRDVQQGHAPPGSQVLPMADGNGFIAVKRRVMVSGDQLTDAKQGYDQDGRPDIEIKFNTAGARRFGRATQENVGKPFAIILDDKVLSYPTIESPILGGT
ncbi:MAG TPA: protein translocase subunit SecD, partial [Sphingomicrobium sp.]